MVDFTVESIQQAVMSGFDNAVQNTIVFLPNLVYAIVLLLIGFFLSGLVAKAVKRALEHLELESTFKKYKVEDALGGNQISPILVSILRWWLMLFFLQAAIEALKLTALTGFITSVLLYVPKLFGVALLIIASAVVAEWLREAILSLHKFYMQKTLSVVSKWAIILMAFMVGMETAGFQMTFVYLVFGYLLSGVTWAFAIAVGLAFGLGGQKDATDIIKRARKKFDV